MNRYKLLLLCCFLALAACFTASGHAGSESTPTSVSLPKGPLPDTLIVTRTSAFPQNNIPSFTPRTVQNAQSVQQLYQAAYAQPFYPMGTYHCPADFGVIYHLQFLHQGTTVLQATLDASGCRSLSLGSTPTRQTTDAFWSLFANVAGIPASDLHPMPQS
jgi:hypothetical protein